MGMVDLELLVIAETDFSVLVSDGDVDVWLPKSRLEFDSLRIGGHTEIAVPEWLAIDRGLV